MVLIEVMVKAGAELILAELEPSRSLHFHLLSQVMT